MNPHFDEIDQLLLSDLLFSINLLPPLSGLDDQSECVPYPSAGQMCVKFASSDRLGVVSNVAAPSSSFRPADLGI